MSWRCRSMARIIPDAILAAPALGAPIKEKSFTLSDCTVAEENGIRVRVGAGSAFLDCAPGMFLFNLGENLTGKFEVESGRAALSLLPMLERSFAESPLMGGFRLGKPKHFAGILEAAGN